MSRPLISVIVPIYNVADYIGACLDSICQQTYTNLEIILVDDGSTDDSLERVADLVAADTRIQVIRQSNQGLSAARNAGLDRATGAYVTFVDSDDRLYPDAISDLYQALVKHQVPLAIGSIAWDGREPICFTEEVLDRVALIEATPSVPHNTVKITAWGKLYARHLFEGIRYPVGKLHEDEYVTYKLYLAAGSAVTIPHLVYHYVARPGSIMASRFSLKNAEVLDAFREKYQVLEAQGLSGQTALKKYRNYTRTIWQHGVINEDQELCRLARKSYWYGFGRLTWKGKLGAIRTYGLSWLKELLGWTTWRRLASAYQLFKVWRSGQDLANPPIFYSDKAGLAYHVNFKAASSSIETVLLAVEHGLPMDGEDKFAKARALLSSPGQPWEAYKHFSFAINPFKRLVSCYENKVVQAADQAFDIYLFGWLKSSKSFDQFVQRVTKIPPQFLEGHLAYQHPIFYKDGQLVLDYVGKVETIREDYASLAQEHDLPALPHKNQSVKTDWRDHYTTALAQQVAAYYREDIKLLGYEDTYQDLLAYLKERNR